MTLATDCLETADWLDRTLIDSVPKAGHVRCAIEMLRQSGKALADAQVAAVAQAKADRVAGAVLRAVAAGEVTA